MPSHCVQGFCFTRLTFSQDGIHELSPKVRLCHSGSVNTINEYQMLQLLFRGWHHSFSLCRPEAYASTGGLYDIRGQSQPLSHKQASQPQDVLPFVDKDDVAWRKAAAIWERGSSHPPGWPWYTPWGYYSSKMHAHLLLKPFKDGSFRFL